MAGHCCLVWHAGEVDGGGGGDGEDGLGPGCEDVVLGRMLE